MLKKLLFLFALCSPCAAQSVGAVNGVPGQSIGNMGATATAGSDGVTVNTFVAPDASAPTKFITAPSGACGSGVSLGTAAAGSSFTLSDALGTVQVKTDSGGAVAGHLLVGSTVTAGLAMDSGQTTSLNISEGTAVCGTALTTVSGGGLATIIPRGRGSFGHKVDQVNSAAIPVSAAVLSTNASGQLVAPAAQAANTVYGNCSISSASPSFCGLTASMIPNNAANTSGNAATATALATTPTTCTVAGQYARGVDAGGNATGCAVPASGSAVPAATPVVKSDGTSLGPATAAGINSVIQQATATIASAATTDLGTVASGNQNVSITGTTAITSFGSTAPAGSVYRVTFAGAAPVLGGSGITLSTATGNLWPAVGDTMTCSVPSAAGAWVCDRVSSKIAWSPDDQTANLTPSALIHWRNVLAKVRAKTGRAKVIFITDSTGIGTGAGTGTANLSGAEPFSLVRAFANAGTSASVPIHQDSFYGDQCVVSGASAAFGAYDTRVTLGTGWAAATAVPTLGSSKFFLFTNGTSGTLSFTPTNAFDTLVLHYAANGTTPTATVNVDGGSSLGTLSQTGSAANNTTTYTVSLGTHTINVIPDNTGLFYLAGVETYNSAVPAVDIIQGGCWGVFAATAISNGGGAPWNAYGVLPYLAPDLTVVGLTINDVNNGTTLSSYLTSVQTIITQAKAGTNGGDVVLMVGAPSASTQSANNTNGVLDSFIAGLAELARSNNVVLLNTKARWTSYAVTNPVMPYADAVHPAKAGYQDLGEWLAKSLLGR